MPVLMDVAVKNPNLQLDISFADRGVDLVEEGIDLVVRLGDPCNQASLVGRRIGTQHSLICASSDYLDRRGRPASVEEQKEHDCLAFSMVDRGQRWCVDILGHSAAPYDHPWGSPERCSLEWLGHCLPFYMAGGRTHLTVSA